MTSTYALRISDDELARYRFMAAIAARDEAADWSAAGIVPGAAVADIGCGPGAVLALLADIVGPDGIAVGVDANPDAVHHAHAAVDHAGHAQVYVGAADATGLDPGAFDVAMCRHVLAHNPGREQGIVDHLAGLVRRGGAVYLVDVEMTGVRLVLDDPDLQDLTERYIQFHAQRAADLRIGLRLGDLLEAAGLTVERFRCVSPVQRVPHGMRGPQWAAREAMVAEGVATAADVERWDAAFDRLAQQPHGPWMFVPVFAAVGRRV